MFGMGTGGTSLLLTPAALKNRIERFTKQTREQRPIRKGKAVDRLVLAS